MLFDVQTRAVPWTAKWAFTTRRVTRADARGLSLEFSDAKAGDLILCEIANVGQHRKIQLSNQRYSEFYPGDQVVLCVGSRYAPDQFQGDATIAGEHCDLMAAGGVAGTVVRAHASMKPPTSLRPLGLVTDTNGEVINIARYAVAASDIPDSVTVIAVVGASMNAGKTTAAVGLAHGLNRAGLRAAGAKATGTGAFGDVNAMEDAGVPAIDFTDAGFASTYQVDHEALINCFETLVGTAASRGADVVVVEFADGIFQEETAALLTTSRIRDRLDGVVFAAPDAVSSAGGVTWLRDNLFAPLAVSGKVTCSPIAEDEAVLQTGVPHLSRAKLCDPDVVGPLVAPIHRGRAASGQSAA